MTRPGSWFHLSGSLIVVTLLTLIFTLPAQAFQAGTPEASPAAGIIDSTNVGPRFLVHPKGGTDGDYFTLEAEAGTTSNLTVVLANIDDEPLSLQTYANDAIPIINGGFAIAAEGVTAPDAPGVAAWIDYPSETFDFEAGEGVEQTFTVTIPEDTPPGQYIAGIALETAEPIEVEGTDLFNQVISKTIAVFIIVPGPEEPAFELGAPEVLADSALSRIVVPVTNTGNVLVKPAGEVVVRNASGETVLKAPVTMGSVYAGTTVQLSVPLTTPLPEGAYTVSVDVADEATGTTASLAEATIAVAAADQAPAQFTMAGDISLSPDAANPAFANVNLTITNLGEPVTSADVVLDAMRDGELVETFSLAPLFAVPQGETAISQRYIPLTGWEAGSWTFVIRLNVVDTSTDASTNVAILDSIPALEVGE